MIPIQPREIVISTLINQRLFYSKQPTLHPRNSEIFTNKMTNIFTLTFTCLLTFIFLVDLHLKRYAFLILLQILLLILNFILIPQHPHNNHTHVIKPSVSSIRRSSKYRIQECCTLIFQNYISLLEIINYLLV